MPRRPRWFDPQVPLHIVQRGVDRLPCFRSPEDHRAYLHWLAKSAAQHGCAVHAYVLMTNHVHLLATPSTANAASLLMQDLGRNYVRLFNRKHGRTGPLVEGRFRAHPVQSERYLLTVHRYIESNPLRAGMVSHPGQYRWSSYACNAWGASDPCVTQHALFLALAETPEDRRAAYRDLFGTALDEALVTDIRESVAKGWPFGDAAFRRRISEAAGIRLYAKPGRPRQQSEPARQDDLFA